MQQMTNRVNSTAKKILAFSPKDRIDHSVFGLGTILEIDKWHTTIAFDESGTRKFMTSMVKLEPSDTPAPPTRPRKRKKVAKSG